jgi:hypothetical protein
VSFLFDLYSEFLYHLMEPLHENFDEPDSACLVYIGKLKHYLVRDVLLGFVRNLPAPSLFHVDATESRINATYLKLCGSTGARNVVH